MNGQPEPGGAHRSVRVASCQLDLCVGDLDGNVAAMAEAYRRAVDEGARLVVFPELAICGYPPEDLLLKPGFVARSQRALGRLARLIDGPAAAVVGWVEGERVRGVAAHEDNGTLYNAAAVLRDGSVVASYRKQVLPNYGPFDELRYFAAGSPSQDAIVTLEGVKVALSICEELWAPHGPIQALANGEADLVVNLSASPFHRGRQDERYELLERRAAQLGRPIVYTNLVGGQDELVFDGGSMVVGSDGSVLAESPRFVEAITVVDVPLGPGDARTDGTILVRPERPAPLDPLEEVWSALVLGLRDYVAKNGFDQVVIGLSGGVDSSIVAAIAVDALGSDRVHGVLMPSRYSSDHSITDAVALADALGMQYRTIPIEEPYAAFLEVLAPSFEGRPMDLTEENIQSRIRGVLLMALSNKLGWLVLTTGNRTESAVGYSTLYGDTAGALAVIKDVPKLLVYELCRWRNDRAGEDLIPDSVLTKAPSAELRPDQRDDESLPAYEILDPLIEAYVDREHTAEELVEQGFDPALVERIVRLVDTAEFKRRQSPPGIRISQKAFGRDRRLPITNCS